MGGLPAAADYSIDYTLTCDGPAGSSASDTVTVTKSSCPFVFTNNGKEIEFISDVESSLGEDRLCGYHLCRINRFFERKE